MQCADEPSGRRVSLLFKCLRPSVRRDTTLGCRRDSTRRLCIPAVPRQRMFPCQPGHIILFGWANDGGSGGQAAALLELQTGHLPKQRTPDSNRKNRKAIPPTRPQMQKKPAVSENVWAQVGDPHKSWIPKPTGALTNCPTFFSSNTKTPSTATHETPPIAALSPVPRNITSSRPKKIQTSEETPMDITQNL